MTWNNADGAKFSNIAANTAAFTLRGGSYGITVHATFGGGNVVLQRLAADASTWINVVTALTADGFATTNLPAGSYRFGITTATGVYCDVAAVATSQ